MGHYARAFRDDNRVLVVRGEALAARAYRPDIVVWDDCVLAFPRRQPALLRAVRTSDVNDAVIVST